MVRADSCEHKISNSHYLSLLISSLSYLKIQEKAKNKHKTNIARTNKVQWYIATCARCGHVNYTNAISRMQIIKLSTRDISPIAEQRMRTTGTASARNRRRTAGLGAQQSYLLTLMFLEDLKPRFLKPLDIK